MDGGEGRIKDRPKLWDFVFKVYMDCSQLSWYEKKKILILNLN